MGKYTKISIKVPDINRSFATNNYKYSNSSVIKENTSMLDKIVKNYSKFMNTWGEEFEIDNSIISGFIATESGGKNAPPNKYNATGLMQVTPNTVWEIIVKWNNFVEVPLSEKSITFFNKAIPSSKKFNSKTPPNSIIKNEILSALENNSEFNIAIGTAVLRWLLEAFKENGIANINKILVSYNAGYYSMRKKVINNPTTEQLINNNNIPKESRAYLLKMLGVNGFLDLWFKKNN